MKTRTVTRLNPEDWPHDSFVGFDSPHAGEYAKAMREAFPRELIAAHIARLPPESRARLERELGKLPTVTTPPIP